MLPVSLYTCTYIYILYTDSTQRQHLGDGMLILSMAGGEISKGHDGSALTRAARPTLDTRCQMDWDMSPIQNEMWES